MNCHSSRRATTIGVIVGATLAMTTLLGACGSSRVALPPPVTPANVALPPQPASASVATTTALPPMRTLRAAHGLTVQLVSLPGSGAVVIGAYGRGAGRYQSDGSPSTDALLERVLSRSVAGGGTSIDQVSVDERGATIRIGVGADRAARSVEWMMGAITSLPTDTQAFEVAQRTLLDAAGLENRDTWRAIMDDLESRLYTDGSARRAPERLGAAAIRETTYDELRARHARYFAPNQTLVVIAGDFRLEAMTEWAQLLADKVQGPAVERAQRALPPPGRPELQGRGYPSDDELGTIVMISSGPSLGADDYAAYELAVLCYGGLFSSRINRLFRSERRESYGASCAISPRAGRSHLRCELSLAREREVDAVDLLLNESRRLGRAAELPPTELETARAVALSSLRQTLESPPGVVNALGDAHFAGLPPESIAERYTRLRTTTVEEVSAAARTYLREDSPFVVVAPWEWIMGHPLHPPAGYSTQR